MNFEIVTDSSANLPETIIEQYGLHVLTLVFRVKDEEFYSYEKGKATDLSKFYTMMREKEHITTSLINSEDCMTMFERILATGKDLLYVGFSSGLSGSYQVVKMVAEELKEKYPERKIFCVDTLAAALGEGLLVYQAAVQRENGLKIEQVYEWLMANRLQVCHWFTVNDLFFLQRGGRISQTSAVVGSMLNIKPVLHVDNEGKLVAVEKTRGRKKSLDALVRHMSETTVQTDNQIVAISHGDCLEDAQYVANRIKEELQVKETLIHILDPVIGAHAGPGTVALFYMGSQR